MTWRISVYKWTYLRQYRQNSLLTNQVNNQSLISWSPDAIQLTLVTTAKVDEMSVTVNESPIQYYTHSEVDFPTSRAQTSSRARTGLFSMFSAAKKERESGSFDRPSLALGPSTVTGNEKRRDLRKSNLEDDFPPTVKLLYVRPLVTGPLNVGPLVLRPLDVRLLIGKPLAVRALDHYQQLGKPLYIKTSQGYKNNPFI